MSLPELLFEDPKGNIRDFSIASSPNNKKYLSILFRNSGSGFKETLLKCPLGTLVNAQGPFGLFTLPPSSRRPLVFLAGGVGITPFLSMILHATEKKLKYQITLIYANWSRKTGAFIKELSDLKKRNPRFVLKNRYGFITRNVIRKQVKDISAPLWYVCGPPPMVEAVYPLLQEMGIPQSDIVLEVFTGY